MAIQLQQFLSDAYESRHVSFPKKTSRDISIQIDDQDDSDHLQAFCNLFCTVLKSNSFMIELIGNFPITTEVADLAEIYSGSYYPLHKRLVIILNTEQIDVLTDLADKIRKTSFADLPENPGWLTISARTISSLYRFVRIIKEYNNLNQKTILNKFPTFQAIFHSIATF
jgi:hypothetical protein